MKTIAVTILICGLTCVSAMAATGDASVPSDRAMILTLEKNYNNGFVTKNVDMIMSSYAPGNQLFVFDVVPPREYPSWDAYKKDWQGLFAEFPGPVTNMITEQTVTVVGSLAYGHNIQAATFTRKDGSKFSLTTRTTDIYRKTGGKWLIVEEHNSVPVDLDTMKPDPLSKM